MATISGSMDIKEERINDIYVLYFTGKLDAITSPAAEKKIFECIHDRKYKLVFDFTGVDYLSSAGLRMLLSTRKKLKALSGNLILTSVTPNVMDVLIISGFDHVLEITLSIEEAIEKIEGKS